MRKQPKTQGNSMLEPSDKSSESMDAASQDKFRAYLRDHVTKAMQRWVGLAIEKLTDMYPNGVVVPLYRSALVIIDQDEEQRRRGAVTLMVHHDPRWTGEEVNPETLAAHSYRIDVWGQRNGPDFRLWPATCECGPTDSFEVLTYAAAAQRVREALRQAIEDVDRLIEGGTRSRRVSRTEAEPDPDPEEV